MNQRQKNFLADMILLTCGILCLILIMIALTGCMVIWSDDIFIVTCMKTVDANDLDIIAEPNCTQIGSGNSKTTNDKVKVSALIGGIPIIIESDGD